MIGQFEIRNRKGIGLIVLLYWFFPMVAAILACYSWLARPALSRVPECYITRRFILGSGLFWGIFCLIIGFFLVMPMVFVCIIEPGPLAFIFLFLTLPLPFTGLFLLLHRIKYQKYKSFMEDLLAALAGKNDFVKSHFSFYYQGKQYRYVELLPYLRDLQRSGILVFEDNENTVEYYFAGEEKKSKVVYEEKVWVCSACGAENKQQVIAGQAALCEYCRTPHE